MRDTGHTGTTSNSSGWRPDVDAMDDMIVTGAQATGARSLGAVQVTGVDTKEVARIGGPAETAQERGTQVKSGEPLPVVFVRDGLPTDTRPSDLRQQRAAQRYQEDGGEFDTRREKNSR